MGLSLGRLARSIVFRFRKTEDWLRVVYHKVVCGGNAKWGAGIYLGKYTGLHVEALPVSIEIGDGVVFRRSCNVWLTRGARLTLGAGVFFNNNCSIYCRDRIEIGEDTLFGEGVRIYDHNHRFRDPGMPIAQQGYVVAPVSIGRNCWIGSNVVILRGVAIGDHVVIGAGCVVGESIPPHSLVRLDWRLTVSPIARVAASMATPAQERSTDPRDSG